MQTAPTCDPRFLPVRRSLFALLGLGVLGLSSAAARQGEPAGVMPAPAAPPEASEPAQDGPRLRAGERLDPSAFGPFVIEGL